MANPLPQVGNNTAVNNTAAQTAPAAPQADNQPAQNSVIVSIAKSLFAIIASCFRTVASWCPKASTSLIGVGAVAVVAALYAGYRWLFKHDAPPVPAPAAAQ